MSNPQEVSSPPLDIISSLVFSPDGSRIAVGSWDCNLHIYATDDGNDFTQQRRITTEAPVLDVCWSPDGKQIFWVGLDHDIRKAAADEDGPQSVLSSHEQASNKVALSPEHNILLSISWDATMHVHDADTGAFVRVKLAGKPFALSLTAERAVVAMAERKVAVYDLTALKQLVEQNGSTESGQTVHEIQPWQDRESSLKFMTRSIACMPDGTGFATSSIEGRVGVEWFDPEVNDAKKYAFKCHRQSEAIVDDDGTEKQVDIVFPVNAVTFHPVHGTFATGGGDGVVALWDAKSKRRVRQYPKLGASIAAVDFSPDGKLMAIGISPGFEDGFEEKELDGTSVKIYIRHLAEGEAKAKAPK